MLLLLTTTTMSPSKQPMTIGKNGESLYDLQRWEVWQSVRLNIIMGIHTYLGIYHQKSAVQNAVDQSTDSEPHPLLPLFFRPHMFFVFAFLNLTYYDMKYNVFSILYVLQYLDFQIKETCWTVLDCAGLRAVEKVVELAVGPILRSYFCK